MEKAFERCGILDCFPKPGETPDSLPTPSPYVVGAMELWEQGKLFPSQSDPDRPAGQPLQDEPPAEPDMAAAPDQWETMEDDNLPLIAFAEKLKNKQGQKADGVEEQQPPTLSVADQQHQHLLATATAQAERALVAQPKGRRKTKKAKVVGKSVGKKHCSKCGQAGHSSRTCTNKPTGDGASTSAAAAASIISDGEAEEGSDQETEEEEDLDLMDSDSGDSEYDDDD